MLGLQRGAKVMGHRLSSSLQGSDPEAVLDPVVGESPTPSMDQRSVTLFPQFLAKSRGMTG
jgi:hypothetical protein